MRKLKRLEINLLNQTNRINMSAYNSTLTTKSTSALIGRCIQLFTVQWIKVRRQGKETISNTGNTQFKLKFKNRKIQIMQIFMNVDTALRVRVREHFIEQFIYSTQQTGSLIFFQWFNFFMMLYWLPLQERRIDARLRS